MGIDCTACIEKRIDGEWECVGLFSLPRNAEMFQRFHDTAFHGYPLDCSGTARVVLENLEDYGEIWTSYEEFRKVLKDYDLTDYDIIRKRDRESCRVILRFDCRR